MYRITCAYGTNQVAWSWREALAWLAVCGPRATICNRLTGATIAGRP
jgi:hypothetical protein